MNLFVPALTPKPRADKAPRAAKASGLCKRGNAVSVRFWGQPFGPAPLGAQNKAKAQGTRTMLCPRDTDLKECAPHHLLPSAPV